MKLRGHFDILAPETNPDEARNIIVDKMFREGDIINKYTNSSFFKKKILVANSYPLKDIRWISLEIPTKKELIVKSLYPASVNGIKSEIIISHINEENRGYEADIEAYFKNGVDIKFFDPFYFFNSHLYSEKGYIDFYFSGLAYSLKKSNEHEVIDDAVVFIPINDVCDYQYRITIEDLDEIYFDNELIYKMKGLVMNYTKTETHFEINLYISAKNIFTENYTPQVGDSVEGLLWLQGYHKAFVEK